MATTYQLTIVAFVRSAAGHVSLLLAVDCGADQLFNGEPALLVEYRPNAAGTALRVEGADAINAATVTLVAEQISPAIPALVDEAFDETGAWDGHRIIARTLAITAPDNAFAV